MRYKKKVGNMGEDFAARLLEDCGYVIMDRNFWTRIGEIDIIARKDGILHFIEVKTRASLDYGLPSEAVTKEKQRKIKQVAELYLCQRKLKWEDVSFDVVEVQISMIKNCM